MKDLIELVKKVLISTNMLKANCVGSRQMRKASNGLKNNKMKVSYAGKHIKVYILRIQNINQQIVKCKLKAGILKTRLHSTQPTVMAFCNAGFVV